MAGIEPSNIEEQRFLLRMTVVGMVPTPAIGGLAGRPAIDSSGVPGVFVAGDWVGTAGLAGRRVAVERRSGRSGGRPRRAPAAPMGFGRCPAARMLLDGSGSSNRFVLGRVALGGG